MTISVTPTKREDTVLNFTVNAREIERTVREKLKDAGVGDFSIDFMQPGRFVPPGFHFGSELPDDLSVTIRKQGKKPADVEVKRGDETWNIKDGDFSALPDELRQPVRSFLLGPARYGFVHGNARAQPEVPHVMVAPHAVRHPKAPTARERRDARQRRARQAGKERR